MKRILCYGDSNTWGFIPATWQRYPADVRWPGVAAKELGEGYELIEEALNGRTSVWEDPVRPYMNSLEYIGPCVLSHFPLDLIIIMLGTNDFKQRFHLNAWNIAEGIRCNGSRAEELNKVSNDGKAKIMLVSPPYIGELIDQSPYGDEFESTRTLEVSRALAKEVERVANENGWYFLDAALYGKASDKDSLHLTEEGHKGVGIAIAKKIKEIL